MNAGTFRLTGDWKVNGLFDAHCHLPDLSNETSPDVLLERAVTAGVSGVACCGTEPNDWNDVGALATRHPQVHPSFGLHPWYVNETPADWRKSLVERLAAFPSAGVGEIGLDGTRLEHGWADQERALAEQWEIAADMRRPVTLHCVKAWDRIIAILSTSNRPQAVVLHACSASAELVRQLVNHDVYFSFTGQMADPSRRSLHAAVAAVPLDRLLIETDSPHNSRARLPASSRKPTSSPGEPADLVDVFEALCRLRPEPPAQLARSTLRNAVSVFAATPGAPHGLESEPVGSVHLA